MFSFDALKPNLTNLNLKNMSLLNKSKKEVVAEFAKGKNDTGSCEVQCAIATLQINKLTEHLKIHKKD